MKIEIAPALLTLISQVEADEKRSVGNASFTWFYNPDGQGAMGYATVQWNYKRFSVYTYGSYSFVDYQDVDKWDAQTWETHPLHTDYRGDN